jgi:hypothetical protein
MGTSDVSPVLFLYEVPHSEENWYRKYYDLKNTLGGFDRSQ